MTLTRNQWLAMQLAGTISIPPTLPDLVRITLVPSLEAPAGVRKFARELLLTEQPVSARVTIRRLFPVEEVAAIQCFAGESLGDVREAEWILGQEITCGPIADRLRSEGIWGVAHVREQAPAFMQVDVGLTAAESAEYYPPLPGDRSQDHYQFGMVHTPRAASSCGPSPCSAWRFPTALSSRRWSDDVPAPAGTATGMQPAAGAASATEPATPQVEIAAPSVHSNGHAPAMQDGAHAT